MGFIKERKDVRGLIQSFEKAVPFLEIFARIPTLSWLVRITWLGRKLWFPRPGDKSGIGIIMQVCCDANYSVSAFLILRSCLAER